MKLCLLAVSLLAVVCACAPATPPPITATTPAATPPPTPNDDATTGAAVVPFSVDVTLSEKAGARLAAAAETLIVSATYFADPTPAGQSQANDVGQIDLGRAQVELKAAGSANFDGRALQQERLALVQDQAQVNINVYSGRKSSPDNLLDCGIFQDSLAVAASKPISIHCKLIAENH